MSMELPKRRLSSNFSMIFIFIFIFLGDSRGKSLDRYCDFSEEACFSETYPLNSENRVLMGSDRFPWRACGRNLGKDDG